MRKVVVTGGAGFIGSELVAQLAQSPGVDITVIDSLVNGRTENISHALGDRGRLVTVDIRNRSALEPLLRDVDVLFHLACLGVRHSLHSPVENHDINAAATLELLDLARGSHVSRFVYVSSSEVYGNTGPMPLSEESPKNPSTIYGASKLAGECYAAAFWRAYNYPVVIVRPFNAYGPRCHHEGDSGEVIPKFMLRSMAGEPMIVFGDGSQARDFMYVSDTARGILMAGEAEAAIGQSINLGTGASISVEALARKVAESVHKPDARIVRDRPRPGDVLHLRADASKAKELLGFEPRVSLDEGLGRLRDWYLSLDQSPRELLQAEKSRNWEIEGLLERAGA